MIDWLFLTGMVLIITILFNRFPTWTRMIAVGVITYVFAIGSTGNVHEYPLVTAIIVGVVLTYSVQGAWRFFRDPSLVSLGPRSLWLVLGVLVWPIGLGLALIEVANRYDRVQTENRADSTIRTYETQIGLGSTSVAQKRKQFQSTTL